MRGRATSPTPCARSRPIPSAKFIAGGTNLVDLMKVRRRAPSRLIDISRLPLRAVEETAERRAADRRAGAQLRPRLSPAGREALSAAVERDPGRRLAATAQHGLDRRQSPAAHALLPTSTTRRRPATNASPAAAARPSTASIACHAILGTSEACIAVHPSDMCVALAALDAKVHVTGPAGERIIAFADFHRLPGDTPNVDTNLKRGRDHHGRRAAGARALRRTTATSRSATACPTHSRWCQLRPRSSWTAGRIREARLGLGGVAHKPWRNTAAEAALRGRPANEAGFRTAPLSRCCATPRVAATTPSKSNWRGAPSSAR